MYDIDTLARLDLGRQGENATKPIEINMRPWRAEFPGASFVLMNVRPEETQPYAAASGSDDVLTWLVMAADVEIEGSGYCEVRCIVDEKVKKSRIIKTLVHEAIISDETEHPPAPVEGWADELAKTQANAMNAVRAATEAAENIVKMANDLIEVERLEAIEEEEGYVELRGTYSPIAADRFPVGSIWMTEAPVDPGTIFGGLWEKIVDRVVIGSGVRHAGDTGGNESIMLTMDQLPEEVQT